MAYDSYIEKAASLMARAWRRGSLSAERASDADKPTDALNIGMPTGAGLFLGPIVQEHEKGGEVGRLHYKAVHL